MAVNNNIAQCRAGLNTDSIIDEIQPGYITEALNAINSAIDGQQVTYQNEEGSVFCFTLPVGYKAIGIRNIVQLNNTYYYLTNPTTGYSMFGYVVNTQCTFNILIDDTVAGSDVINWSIQYPILKTEVKTTNCSTQLYFTDRYNVRRYIDLNNLPFYPGTTAVDTNMMNVQPTFSIPNIVTSKVSVGGNIIEGDYQFCIQYADVRGNGLTRYYSVTNPVRIFLTGKTTLDTNLLTNQAIEVDISQLDTTGLYSYFNLVVIKTINATATPEYLGTYHIQTSTYSHTYTGLEQSGINIPITMTEIMEQFEYYDIAGTLCQVDDVLVWGDLIKEEDISYQQIWSQVRVGWGTSQVPYGSQGQLLGYSDGVVCANYEGYFRDEVYALEGCFLFNNGKQSTRFHIPGRVAIPYDLQPVPIIVPGTTVVNSDVQALMEGTCPPPILPRWKVYNTGTPTGMLTGSADPCTGVKPWEHGTMSYWESTDRYPANTNIWGTLSNTPIRHHKFPDSTITHIHDAAGNVYPIGFLVDIGSLQDAIASSTLTQAQKNAIVGFKIMRSDRGADRSIVAKGLLFNCGHYQKDGSDYFYANYPFNDVRPDPFISLQPVEDKSRDNAANRLNDFQHNRFTFHSPDTHFYQAAGIQGAFLKLETAEYGTCTSHFVQVKDNAGEKIITKEVLGIAFAVACLSTISLEFDKSNSTTTGTEDLDTTSTHVMPKLDIQNFFPTYNTMLEVLTKLVPYFNYGWQYNGLGQYENFTPIPDDVGNKIRYIQYGGYVNSGINSTFGDIYPLNNTDRESSVYVSVNNVLPYTHEQYEYVSGVLTPLGIPQDTSRVTAAQAGVCNHSTPFNREVSSYYCSLKRQLDDQYGEIFSYQVVDTGTQSKLLDSNGNRVTTLPIVYGGDCFINQFALKIKQAFYLKSTVNRPDGYDINYNQDSFSHTNTGNIGYPIYYYSTDNVSLAGNNPFQSGLQHLHDLFNTPLGIGILILTGGLALVAVMLELIAELFGSVFFQSFGLKITNLECNNYDTVDLYERGMAYLYAYGIINYYCESEVNVSMRQAYNIKEGNFWPNVGTGIPDEWLQETNVPIAFDNTYTYNKTYSGQNKQTAFTTLRPDWAPDQVCYIDYNNRAIWSDKSSLEETKNNYLVYRPANLFDFPKKFGTLQTLDTLESRTVLVRYQNDFEMYNAMATVDTSSITAVLGTGALFSGSQPVQINKTDIGYMGTLNKFLLNTEQGHVWADAARGKIVLLRGNSAEELSGPKYHNSKYFQDNLPFQILNTFPNYPVDNNFNGIGLHGVYDNFYKRLIITKIDYSVLPGVNLQYDGTNFYTTVTLTERVMEPSPGSPVITCCPDGYILEPADFPPSYLGCYPKEGGDAIPAISCGINAGMSGTITCCPNGYEYIIIKGDASFCWNPDTFTSADPTLCPTVLVERPTTEKVVVELGDPRYFCNKSLTMSFSFISNSWSSWHSYIPNYYIEHTNYFQAGYNSGTPDVWDHNSTFVVYQTYRGIEYPYILEAPFIYKYDDQIFQGVQDYLTVLKYTSPTLYNELDGCIYFNKIIAYNNQQNTGTCVVVPKDENNLYTYRQYPIYGTDNVAILVEKVDHMLNTNMYWDKVKDTNQPIWETTCDPTQGRKILVDSNMDYGVRSFRKYQLRSKDMRIRLILDNRNDLKFLSRYTITQTQDSK